MNRVAELVDAQGNSPVEDLVPSLEVGIKANVKPSNQAQLSACGFKSHLGSSFSRVRGSTRDLSGGQMVKPDYFISRCCIFARGDRWGVTPEAYRLCRRTNSVLAGTNVLLDGTLSYEFTYLRTSA